MPAYHVYLCTPTNPPTCAGSFPTSVEASALLNKLGIDLLPAGANTWIAGEGEGPAIAAVAGCYARFPAYATALPLVLDNLLLDSVWGYASTTLWITLL